MRAVGKAREGRIRLCSPTYQFGEERRRRRASAAESDKLFCHGPLVTIVFLIGGAIIMFTAVREISHRLSLQDIEDTGGKHTGKSAASLAALIVFVKLIFCFDSTAPKDRR